MVTHFNINYQLRDGFCRFQKSWWNGLNTIKYVESVKVIILLDDAANVIVVHIGEKKTFDMVMLNTGGTKLG